MSGRCRRPLAWLLWLMLALLPLRGWAQDAMALTAAANPTQAPSCHGDGAGLAAPQAAHHQLPGAACSHCDLCQTAAPFEPPLPALDALAQAAPGTSAPRMPAAAVAESLFRPPRP